MSLADLLQVFLFGMVWGGVYALIAGGLNLIFGVMKVLNVAHGELVMLAAYGAYWGFTLLGVSPMLSAVLLGPAAAMLGVVLHDLVAEPLMRTSRNISEQERTTLIAFFGLILVFRDTALLLWKAEYRTIQYLTTPVSIGKLSLAPSGLVVLVVATVVTLAMFYLLHGTMVGRALRAVSQDRQAAQLMGISVRSINRWGFALGSLLAGVAGTLLIMIYVISPSVGTIFTTKAFAISVMGGLGNHRGALIAAIALGLAESFGSLVFGEAYRDAVGYALLVLVILWRFRSPFLRVSGV